MRRVIFRFLEGDIKKEEFLDEMGYDFQNQGDGGWFGNQRFENLPIISSCKVEVAVDERWDDTVDRYVEGKVWEKCEYHSNLFQNFNFVLFGGRILLL